MLIDLILGYIDSYNTINKLIGWSLKHGKEAHDSIL